MSDADAPTPEPTPPSEPAAPAASSAPTTAPDEKKGFRRRDELGLLILALVLTGFTWAIARGSVIKQRPPIEAKVVYERTAGEGDASALDVAFEPGTDVVSVQLKCSEPEWNTWKQRLQRDGLPLRIGAITSTQRDISADDGDGYLLPFDERLLDGRVIPLPRGQVIRVEHAVVEVALPKLPTVELEALGIRAKVISIKPNTFPMENVRANLFDEELQPDPIRVGDLRLEEPLGAERQVVATFKNWLAAAGDDTDAAKAARAKAMKDFPSVIVTVQISGGEQREVKNVWRWGLTPSDPEDYTFRLKEEKPVGVTGQFMTGQLSGTATQLDAITSEEGKGRWFFQISFFKDARDKFPPPGSTEEVPVEAIIRLVHDGDPMFDGVRFVPLKDDETDQTNVQVIVSRK